MTQKTALIVGASYGIGRAVAIGLAREGFDIIIIARGLEGLQETESEVKSTGQRCLTVQADISVAEETDKALDVICRETSSVDVLWNGASPFSDEGLEAASYELIRELADTTFFGIITFTKKLLPLLLANNGAHIINVASDWALPGSDGPAPFSAAKYALVGFTEGLNNEFSSQGVYASTLYLAEVGSMFSIDDPIETVREASSEAIVLTDVVKAVSFMISLKTSYVPSLVLLGS